MTCHEVSLSAKDARGSTPFGYTLKYKNDRAANLILQRDPSAVEHLDNRGRSLLHLAGTVSSFPYIFMGAFSRSLPLPSPPRHSPHLPFHVFLGPLADLINYTLPSPPLPFPLLLPMVHSNESSPL